MKTILLKMQFISCLVLLACFLSFVSCDKNEEIPIVDSDAGIIPVKYLDAVKALGFDESTLKEIDEGYLVEGDIILDKEWIEQLALEKEKGIEKQMRQSGDLISCEKRGNISVYINSDNFNFEGIPEWIPDIRTAIAAWNNIPDCSLKFVITSNSVNSDIYISVGNNGTGELISAKYPFSGKAGNLIKIQSEFTGMANLTSSQRIYNMVHAIGHTVGLKHTNNVNMGQTGSEHIPGTPTSDPASVMNYGSIFTNWNGFSNGDKIALETLYGKFKVWFEGASTFPSCLRDSDRGWTYCTYVLANKKVASYKWSAGGGRVQSGQGTPQVCVTVESPYTFSFTLEAISECGERLVLYKYIPYCN